MWKETRAYSLADGIYVKVLSRWRNGILEFESHAKFTRNHSQGAKASKFGLRVKGAGLKPCSGWKPILVQQCHSPRNA
jgi:hypothetical protein